METRRRKTRTGLVRAAPAKARLADVVCRFGNTAGKSVDWRPGRQTPAGLPRRGPIVRTQPVSREATQVCSRDVLSLPLYDAERTTTNWRVVETPGAKRISANDLAGSAAVTIETQDICRAG